MAWSQVPDFTDVYTNENQKGIYLVVNGYADNTGYRNWYYEDKEAIRDDIGCGTDTVEFVNGLIEAEGWKLHMELEKQWFQP